MTHYLHISFYEESRVRITKELAGKEGIEREHVEIRIESCDRLIDGLYEKLNPTKKKEMYKWNDVVIVVTEERGSVR